MNENMARRIARNSTHKTYLHVAIITKGSKVLSVGYNKGYEHAETVALKRLLRDKRNNKNIPKGLTLTSFMFKRKNDNLGNSKPCSNCARTIAPYINSVFYHEKGMLKGDRLG